MNTAAVLTNRENQIAELLAWGAAKKEIADKLFISDRTVENHVKNIYSKVNCQKATELSVWYFCTRFHISFDLSPLTRRNIAIILLALVLPSQIMSASTFTRTTRTRSERARASRRRNESELDLTNLF